MPAVEDNKFIESVKNEYIRRGDVADYVNKMRDGTYFKTNNRKANSDEGHA